MKTGASPLHITIEYKKKGSKNWETIELSPQEYFDLETDEEIAIDSIPKYNHAIEYLERSDRQILVTRIVIIDRTNQHKLSIVEKFWNQGKNRLIERSESGQNSYWETILETQVSQNPPLWEILRIGREEGIISPLYHGFLQDNEDGSQTETQVGLE